MATTSAKMQKKFRFCPRRDKNIWKRKNRSRNLWWYYYRSSSSWARMELGKICQTSSQNQ